MHAGRYVTIGMRAEGMEKTSRKEKSKQCEKGAGI
jgi:hypothetical protein